MAIQGLIVDLDGTLVDTGARAVDSSVSEGAADLLRSCRARGLKLGLVSGGRQRLEAVQAAVSVRLEPLFDAVVVAGDCEVGAAAKALGLHPAQCAVLTALPDAAGRAKHAGAVGIGLLSGGHEAAALHAAGARLGYEDTADLLHHLDDALQKASPARLRLTAAGLEKIMDHALEAAERAMEQGDVPIGSALLDGDGRLVASAHNEMASSGNKTAHAEIVTFARAAGKIPLDARDSILVSTLEPCVMCTGAAMEAAVDTIVYGLKAPADSGTGRVNPPSSPESQMPRIVGDIRADESRALLKRWLDKNEDNPQAAFVRQLLRLTGEG